MQGWHTTLPPEKCKITTKSPLNKGKFQTGMSNFSKPSLKFKVFRVCTGLCCSKLCLGKQNHQVMFCLLSLKPCNIWDTKYFSIALKLENQTPTPNMHRDVSSCYWAASSRWEWESCLWALGLFLVGSSWLCHSCLALLLRLQCPSLLISNNYH